MNCREEEGGKESESEGKRKRERERGREGNGKSARGTLLSLMRRSICTQMVQNSSVCVLAFTVCVFSSFKVKLQDMNEANLYGSIQLLYFKGSPDLALAIWVIGMDVETDFSEHIQGCKSPGDPLNSSHFDAPNTKSAPTGIDCPQHHFTSL